MKVQESQASKTLPCNTTTARFWAESSEDVLPGTLWCRTSWLTPLWLPHWGKGCWDGNRNIHSGFPLLACWNFVSSAFIKSKEITMTREKKRSSQQTHIKRERRRSTFGRRHVFEWRRGDVLWRAGCWKHFWRCLLYSSLCSPWDTEQFLFYLIFFRRCPKSHLFIRRGEQQEVSKPAILVFSPRQTTPAGWCGMPLQTLASSNDSQKSQTNLMGWEEGRNEIMLIYGQVSAQCLVQDKCWNVLGILPTRPQASDLILQSHQYKLFIFHNQWGSYGYSHLPTKSWV